MILLPMVERELRVAARRWSTYWKRVAFALIAIIAGTFAVLGNWDAPSYRLSGDLFGTLVFLSSLYCLGFGLFSTADCLSSEKREGTLGLLFLTDLKGYDVVLGKLVISSISGFYATLALCPVLTVPILLGGVTGGDVCRVALTLANTLLFSLAAGVLVSTISLNPRKAMAGTLVLLLCFVAALPAGAGLILYFTPGHQSRLAESLFWGCPFYTLVQASDDMYRVAKHHEFWCSLGVTHGLIWLFLVCACRLVPHCWQDRPAGSRGQRWREWRRNWVYGSAGCRQVFRARLLSINAFYWLAGRAWSKPAWVWAFLGLVAALWAWGCVRLGSDWFNEAVYYLTALLLNSTLKIWIASEAGRQLAEDRRSGALELVLSTSLRVRDILRGQFLALRRQFLGPLLVVIAVELIFLAASLQRESFREQPINPVIWITSICVLVADISALIWCAMWGAMTAKNPTYVTAMTLARILVAPWALFIALTILANLYVELNGVFTWEYFVGLWFVLSLLTDSAFGLACAWQLRTRFRALALERFVPQSPFLGGWKGYLPGFPKARPELPSRILTPP